ncbi:MAG: hypothetical protein J0M33_28700 [Anaerolineae bacterium]|nr:hypothetical protein [Anaerolineae bacterium]
MTTISSTIQRYIYPHAYFTNGAFVCLQQARQTEEGRFYNLLSTMLFSAFALESFLNLVGIKQLPETWNEIEAKLGPDQKLKLLAELKPFNYDMSRRPFQSFAEIFGFRNTVVHAKPEMKIVRDSDKPPESKLLDRIDLERASRFYDDSTRVIEYIYLHYEDVLPHFGIPEIQVTHNSLAPLEVVMGDSE